MARKSQFHYGKILQYYKPIAIFFVVAISIYLFVLPGIVQKYDARIIEKLPEKTLEKQEIKDPDFAQLEIINPEFTGQSADGKNYRIIGQKAEKIAKDRTKVLMPHGFFYKDDGQEVQVTAEFAYLIAPNDEIELNGNVHLIDGNNNVFTDKAYIKTKENSVSSEEKVKVVGEKYTLYAEGFNYNWHSKKILFHRNVKTELQ